MLLFAVLALLPDIDALAGLLGHRLAPPLDHRGATHSLAFGVAVACALAALVPARRDRLVFLLGATVALVSHPMLDMLTHGGRGVMLYWPLSARRYGWPWAPLPAAPIGLKLLSARGLSALALEALVFAPFLVMAFWPRGRPGLRVAARERS
jgi:inner membrane protein